MNRTHAIATLFCAVLGLSSGAAAAQQNVKADLSNETVGAEPKSFLSVVGVWRIEAENGKNVLTVDGRQWKEGQSSPGLADKPRPLYGARYSDFPDPPQT